MTIETTVLLVDAGTLPASLEEQLSKRSVFVEHTSAQEVGQVAPVLVPDLVVQSGRSELAAVLESLTEMIPRPSFVVLADRATIKKLRADDHPQVGAIIPEDLPIAAVAHRIATMARRSAEGKPIDPLQPAGKTPSKLKKIPSRAPAAPGTAAPAQTPNEGKETDSTRGPAAGQPAQAPNIKHRAPAETSPRTTKPTTNSNSASTSGPTSLKAKPLRAKPINEKPLSAKSLGPASTRPVSRHASAPPRPASSRPPASAAAPPETARHRSPVRENGLTSRHHRSRSERPPGKRASSAVTAKKEKLFQEAAEPAPLESTVFSTVPPAPSSGRHPTKSVPPPRVVPPQVDDELSVVVKLPVELRLPLTTPKERVAQTRLALLDTDLTRADSLSSALRRRSIEVFPVTPDVVRTRWPLLRRFAPQGLVVDEKSMARSAAEWVETFRGDPFLRHVPLVVLRYSQLFRTQGDIDLEPLLRLLEPLGHQEHELLHKLAPARQVDLKLTQVTPYRLVQLLTEQNKHTRLDCRDGGERIVWPLGPGYVGKAKLLKDGSEKVLAKLLPEESLNWLLMHDDCQISVHEHAEALAHASERVDATQLLLQMTEALGRPLRHHSLVPPGGSHAEASGALSRPSQRPELSPPPPTLPPPTLPPSAPRRDSPAPLALPFAATVPPPTTPPGSPDRNSVPQPGTAATEPGAAVPRQARSNPPPFRGRPTPHQVSPASENRWDWRAWRDRLTVALPILRQTAGETWTRYQRLWAPLSHRVKPEVLRLLVLASPLFVILLLALLVGALGDDPDTAGGEAGEKAKEPELNAQTSAPSHTAPGGPAKAAHSAEDPAGQDDIVLWKVAPDAALPSCETVLGPAAPRGPSKDRSLDYWRQARKSLMKGDNKEALEQLCLAGLLDKTGPAPEGLAEYYLGQRSLAEAERWVRASLEVSPESRKSLEILGDIENQKGNPDAARELWLKTMRLTGSEKATLQAIARKLMRDARLASRGGALPRAERELRRAVTLDPENAAAAIQLAEVFLAREQLAAAISWAERARKLDPHSAQASILSGQIAEKQGDFAKARISYQSVPSGDPLYQEAQTRLERLP